MSGCTDTSGGSGCEGVWGFGVSGCVEIRGVGVFGGSGCQCVWVVKACEVSGCQGVGTHTTHPHQPNSTEACDEFGCDTFGW